MADARSGETGSIGLSALTAGKVWDGEMGLVSQAAMVK